MAAYPSVSLTTDQLYIGGRVSFMACNTLTVIFLVFELGSLFVGATMFRERHNLIGKKIVKFSLDFAFLGGNFVGVLHFPALAVSTNLGHLGCLQVIYS